MTSLNGTVLAGMMGVVGVLFWPGVIIWLIWFGVTRGKRRAAADVTILKPKLAVADGLFNVHLTGASAFIVVLLVMALMAICERALYDISRTFFTNYDYVNSLETILVHAAIIIPLLVVSIVVNVVTGRKKQRYAMVLIPYFVTSVLLTVQLVCQISVYFYNHHTRFQFYLVILAVIAIVSYAIYYIQNLYNKKIEEMKHSS